MDCHLDESISELVPSDPFTIVLNIREIYVTAELQFTRSYFQSPLSRNSWQMEGTLNNFPIYFVIWCWVFFIHLPELFNYQIPSSSQTISKWELKEQKFHCFQIKIRRTDSWARCQPNNVLNEFQLESIKICKICRYQVGINDEWWTVHTRIGIKQFS